ncbi:BTAD domain-containing putative transcriptional regulator [Nonomuraea sp. B19D2]|uniref:AfsR/SARP family transcriptional regulator n=1 Tax=Nonomuraea sp. B19D2 TaxID=3159561 RepID=UPI0032DAE1EF
MRWSERREARLSGKQRAVLTSLLLHANTVVPRQRLVAALWETPPTSAVSNLQTYIAQLRQALPPGTRLLTRGTGYLFEALPEEVDLLAFEQAVQSARAEHEQGNAWGAVHQYETALSLWRGGLAEGTELVGPVLARAAQVEEQRTAVRLDWSEAKLGLGQPAEVIPELRAVVAEQPLRERAWHLLMLALSQTGQRDAALEAFGHARATLIDDLGIEPSRKLQQLQADILADTVTVGKVETWRRICQLPPDIADIVDRPEELHRVTTALRRNTDRTTPAIAVLLGPSGIGKSTLAVHAAHQLREDFPDGQLYLNLKSGGTAREPAALLAEALRSLQCLGSDIPDSTESRAALYRSLLADRAVLVVLDDAEHEQQVRYLLPGTPRSAVLVTSRSPLPILAGATRISVDLPSEAVGQMMLAQIAGEDRVRSEPDAARAIVLACGRLPLAIRVAGARLATRPTWPLQELATRLTGGQPLDELVLGELDIRRTFAASHQLLPDLAGRAFRLLGLAGIDDFAEWVVAALLGASPRETDTTLETLVAAGLLSMGEIDQSGQPRYRMHDLLRKFAHERAEADDSPEQRDVAIRRFVDESLARVRVAGLEYPPPVVPMAAPGTSDGRSHGGAAWLSAERETLLTAVGLAHADAAAELVLRLTPFLVVTGFRVEATRLLQQAAQRTADRDRAILAQLAQADIELDLGRLETARDMFRTVFDHFDSSDDAHSAAYALTGLVACDLLETEPESWRQIGVKKVFSRFESADGIGDLLDGLFAVCAAHQQDHQEVIRLFRQALLLIKEQQYGDPIARFLRALLTGIICFRSDDAQGAIKCYQEGLDISHDLGWGPGERYTLRRLSEAYHAAGRPGDAVKSLYGLSLLSAQTGDTYNEALSAYFLGEISLEHGQSQAAADYFIRCHDLMDRHGNPVWRARARQMIDTVRAESGSARVQPAADATNQAP